MINPTTNYAVADFVSTMNFGIIRNVRCVKLHKTTIALRLINILYKQGVLRTFKVGPDFIAVYYKFFRSRHIISKLKVVSKPSLRCS